MKKLLMILLNEFTHDNRVLNEARSLREYGYNVTVIAFHKDGLPADEVIDGVKVHRIKLLTKSRNKGFFIKAIKYFLFFFKIVVYYKSKNIFLIHCHDLLALPIGVFFKWASFNFIHVIYDAHEHETQRNGLTGIGKIIAIIIERLLIKYADAVIVVSDSIAEEYSRLYYIKKPEVILNCPLVTSQTLLSHDHFRKRFGIRKDQLIFLYQGYLCKGRGIEILIEAFLKKSDDKHVIIFMGEGELYKRIIISNQSNKILFYHKPVSPGVLLEYTASADFGVSFIEDVSLSDRYCLPNKMFEYLAAGLPIICSNLPEMKRFVDKYKVGVVALENNVRGFISAVEEITNMDKKELLDNVNRTAPLFTWKSQEIKLLALYSSFNK
ncbi:MAG: glycosyltransferase [Candidatus Omnitrophota bacterium]